MSEVNDIVSRPMTPKETLEQYADELVKEWTERMQDVEKVHDVRGTISTFRSCIVYRPGKVSREERNEIADKAVARLRSQLGL